MVARKKKGLKLTYEPFIASCLAFALPTSSRESSLTDCFVCANACAKSLCARSAAHFCSYMHFLPQNQQTKRISTYFYMSSKANLGDRNRRSGAPKLVKAPQFRKMCRKLWIVSGLLLFVTANFFGTQGTNNRLDELCADCKLAGQSIDELIKKPRQMNSYGHVDDRIDLEKIKKAACKDLVLDGERERCRNFYFNNLDTVDKWKRTNPKMSFYDYICIKELKYCCPENSYGPKCTKCPKCAKNEQCQGEGTRSGNGSCVCRQGHFGPNCNSCLRGFYSDQGALRLPQTPNKMILCKPCHRSCEYCRQAGPQGCEVCRKGFNFVPDYGCLDIDECLQSQNKICGQNTFCVNTEGSYFCYECDRACDGCHGDGPDMCLRCAKGYKLDNGNCAATRKTILPPEANYYRYAIYAGLCVCTCIILHNNVYLASLVGLSVAFYIGASEYVMSGHPGLATPEDAKQQPISHSFAGHYPSHIGL